MIRVFLADDHAIVRDGLRRHVDDEADMRVVGETHDGNEVLRRATEEEWDVLVLDLSLHGLPGIEVLKGLRSAKPSLPVLVLSMYPEDQHGPRLLRSGAAGYLSKGRSAHEVVDAIRKVAAGARYVTSEVAERLLTATRQAPHEQLSRREHQIFLLIARGQTPSEIAITLNLGPSTVSTYIARVREKLGAKSNGELVQYAYLHGLVTA